MQGGNLFALNDHLPGISLRPGKPTLMIPSLNISHLSAASTSLAIPVDEKHADNDAVPTFVRSQGRAVGISNRWVSAGKGRFSPDQGLMLEKAARALVAQEPIMRQTQQPNGGTFEFAAGLGSAHHAVYEHDGQNITKLAVRDRGGKTLVEIDARDLSAQSLGKHPRSSSSPDSDVAQNSRSRGAQASDPASIHESRLPLSVHVAGQQFHVGPLRKRLDPELQPNLLQALLAEPKTVVSDNLHQGYRAISFIANIDNANQFITFEMDRQGNLRGAAGAVMGSHQPTFTVLLNPLNTFTDKFREVPALKSQAAMLAAGPVWGQDERVSNFKEISLRNINEVKATLWPLEQHERAFMSKLLSQPFFATHVTTHDVPIDRPDGSVSLFSRVKLQERNISFKEMHSTGEDISEVGGDDQVYFSLESGHEPQKGRSRFGDRMMRFDLNHPAFVKTGVMTLVDPFLGLPPSAYERFDAIMNHFRTDPDDDPSEQEEAVVERLNNRFFSADESAFHGPHILEGIGLHIVSTLREYVPPQVAKTMLYNEDINSLVNGLFRPQIMVPRHFFAQLHDQAEIHYDSTALP
ncbi:hypothetical protein V466_25585 [Pseudomonas mandelii PD30]|uniref:Uncharacterized protein n=2 Tax=Pseudomonas TaxID=286 RepID=A0A059KVU3_9PSED|nr:hypothetical protein V466_25585 [Pseudomonas mandelii PD30]